MNSLMQTNVAVPADHPFLGFLNTVDDDGKTRDINVFSNSVELVAMMLNIGLPSNLRVPDAAETAELLVFREAAYKVLSAAAAKRPAPTEAAARVATVIKRAVSMGQFEFTSQGLSMNAGTERGLLDVLALEMLDLTTSTDFGRLSECKRCTRMFIDRGRGRGRRWCEMARCGNRAKAESFRARRRADPAG